MELFTPLSGFIGGSMIGLAAGTLLLLNGDILGASGIMSTSMFSTSSPPQWKLLFLASFLITSLVLQQNSDFLPIVPLENVPVVSPLAHAVGGFLVGVGTKLGNGCTSGHGICGLARLSKRSFAAVGTFMAVAMATVYVMSHAKNFGLQQAKMETAPPTMVPFLGYLLTAWVILRIVWPRSTSRSNDNNNDNKMQQQSSQKHLGAILAGALFSMGLAVSQMISAQKVRNFLDVSLLFAGDDGRAGYDPTLMTVMGGGVLVSAMSYYLSGHPNLLCLGDKCRLVPRPMAMNNESSSSEEDTTRNAFAGVPTNQTIDGMLIGGAALFGAGWGIAGICPGPSLYAAAAGSVPVVHQWLPAFFAGSFLAQLYKDRMSEVSSKP